MKADELAPGRPFGGAFTLLRPLGAGGAASVWLAREDALGREVALKIPASGDPAARGRFLDEARALAAVRHPGVAPVLRYGTDPATSLPFFAMPVFLRTLADRLDGGARLPEAESAALGLALVPAIAALHAAGIAHRDLKPSNILLDAAGAPVLADPCTALRGGTPAWAAPEQVEAARRDSPSGAAADWHALGLLLYRALAGALPPPRGILPAVVEPPRGSLPRDLRPRPSRGWEPLLRALLDPDPATRLADPATIRRALRRLRRRARGRAVWRRVRRPALLALGGLAAAAILAVAAIRLFAGRGEEAATVADGRERALRDAIGNEERPLGRLRAFLDAAMRDPAPDAEGRIRVPDGAVLFADDVDGLPSPVVLLDGGTLFLGPRRDALESLAAAWRDRADRLRATGDPGLDLPPAARSEPEAGTRVVPWPIEVGAGGGSLVAYDEENDLSFLVTNAIRRAPGVGAATLRCDGFSNLILGRAGLDPGLTLAGRGSVAEILPDGRTRARRWFDADDPL